jgi:Na+-transporting methylmalonyl-CoA/oxaloacetate decarboxylase gamma subunit
METNLRPLTLGEILDRTAQMYRTNFLLFAGMFSIYAAVSLVLGLAQLGLATLIKGKTWAVWASLSVGGVRVILIFLLLGAAIAAISRAVASINLGEPVSIRSAYASTLPKLGRYLWLMTITFFRAWGPIVVVYGGLLVAALILSPAKKHAAAGTAAPVTASTQDPFLYAILGVAFLVLFLPALVYAIWMNIRYALSIPACVVEDLKARQAIKRSIALSKGARGRIFTLLLLVLIIKMGLVGLTQSFIFVMAFKHPGHLPTGMNALSQVIQFFTNTFLGPIGATGVTLFYFDQRVRKEGYDIEWMMQAAGLTVESAPAPEPVSASAEAVPAAEPERDQALAPLPPAGITPATETPGNAHE